VRKAVTRSGCTGPDGAHKHRILNPCKGEKIAPGFCALAIMTKAPRAGAVKTRLQPPLTATEAAELNVCFLRDTASAISRTGGKARGVAVYTPVEARHEYDRILPCDFELLPQRGNGFGERLFLATEDLLRVGFQSCCLIDSDSPTVTAEVFRETVDALEGEAERVVLGPTDDGGYYLIGMKYPYVQLFADIDWSTERVFDQTVTRAQEIGLEVHLLPSFFDVDDRTALRRLCDEVLGKDGESAPATTDFLRQIVDREGRDRIWPL
jgi:rSAM/selenodomain-associated transferase 1